MFVRDERPDDVEAIRKVNDQAFGQPQEGRLVDLLRANGTVHLSLVATVEDRIVGHILFSPVRLEAGAITLEGTGLGPMAVRPALEAARLPAAPAVARYRNEFSMVE